MSEARVRRERAGDVDAIDRVVREAFGQEDEAGLVRALREAVQPMVSLVAERDGGVIGHVLFSPLALREGGVAGLYSLAPVSVAPAHQSRGVGTALIRAGLEACREAGGVGVVVVGEPGYYGRFGFVPAERFGMAAPFDCPPGIFQALELRPGGLRGVHGTVRYPPPFDALT